MTKTIVIRENLSDSKAFRQFWKKKGPFAYALTSSEFPPVLLDPEEWLFADALEPMLKELMQYDRRGMKVIAFSFNPVNRSILRPGDLIPWKISNFPEEWNDALCECFMPEGHLTRHVFKGLNDIPDNPDPVEVEAAFFNSLAHCLHQIGYLLFKPADGSEYADINAYLKEWEADDVDAGLL